MKNTFKQTHACLLLLALTFSVLATACGGDDNDDNGGNEATIPQLTLPEEIVADGMGFTQEGGSQTLSVKSNMQTEAASSAPDWCGITPESSQAEGVYNYKITVAENSETAGRTATITVKAGTLSASFNVTQTAAADSKGMESNAAGLAAKIKIGWNLGNSLEVPAGETAWGNPKTTRTLIDAVKAAGFNAVRIPCAWDSYLEDQTSYKIKESWLARVAEVVDYCLANDMYAIINTHWDGGWLENNPTYAKQGEVNRKLKAIWTQIAKHFAAYDEHLLFAGTNEVHMENVYTDPTAENNAVQQSFNQTFVSAVRATGGNNRLRNLIVQTYNTNIDWGVRFLRLPEDVVENRLMVEVHYYDPYNFTLDENASSGIKLWGEPYKQYGKTDGWGQEDYLEATFARAKAAFIDKGYPVILGEYGAIRRSALTGDELQHHLDARAYYLKTVTATAKKHGIVPFYWDNGYEGNNTLAIFRRATGAVYDQQALDALMEGAGR